MTTSYQPWYAGQTYPSWDIPLTVDGGTEDLTGVTIGNFSVIFRSLSGVDYTGTGTVTLKTANPAEIYYKPSVADVTNSNTAFAAGGFNGYIIIEALFPPSNTSADKVIYDPIPFVIIAD